MTSCSYIKLKSRLSAFQLTSNDYLDNCYTYQSNTFAKPTTHPVGSRSLLERVSHLRCLPSITLPVPGCRGNFTYIPFKTAATNSAHNSYTSGPGFESCKQNFFGLYTLCRAPKVRLYATHESTEHAPACLWFLVHSKHSILVHSFQQPFCTMK